MIRVHHLQASRSHRVLWLLEELGQPYEIVVYARDPKTMLAPPELKAVHPLGKSPVVEVEGRKLAESGAIVESLLHLFGDGRLRPETGSDAWYRYLYFLHYAEGSLMSPLLLKLVLSKLGPLGWPAQKYVNGEITKHLDFLEGELAQREWFAGPEFTAADIQMSYPVIAAAGRMGLGERPKLGAYLARIKERPGYQRAIERGGPVELGK